MAKITLNGRIVEALDGALVIDIAEREGFHVPHYCYHPALGNPGNCRLCIVEVEGAPKPQVSCRLKVQEGMVVRTDSPAAKRAQSASLEFHLVNHPLDCPVCDQSGECGLQDYYMSAGRYQSSVREDKGHKAKRKPVGPHVMLDQERCILCTLCTRFTDNVTKTHELGIFGRGHSEIVDLAPGKTLDNPYSGNVVDICPVGALTDRDFRYKVRVWYLDETDSACAGCARACAISLHTSTQRPWHNEGRRVARIKPRFDPRVNGHWICDEGRYSARSLDEGRLGHVLRLRPERAELAWDAALEGIAAEISRLCATLGPKGLAVAASGALSNQDWASFRRLFVDTWPAGRILFTPEPDQVGEADAILRRREKVPNLKGGEALGFGAAIQSESWDGLARGIESGDVWGVYIVDRDVTRAWGAKAAGLLSKPELTVFQGPFKGGAGDLVQWRLPATAFIEEDGAFTNFEGIIQPYKRALEPLGQARPDWAIFDDLRARAGSPAEPAGASGRTR